MNLKTIETITLDWKEFSDEAFKEFKKSLEKFGLYLGDLYADYYQYGEGEGNGTDTYCLYIAKRKLKPKEIKEIYGDHMGLDDEQQELFDMNEFRDRG
jgi:hypothetical protein